MEYANQTLVQTLIKSVFLTIFFLFLFTLLTLISLGIFAYRQWHSFTTTAQTTPRELYQKFQTGWQLAPQQSNDHKNLLILGLDTLETRGNSQPLTDTMILASLNLKTGTVNTLSLPRDLWHEDYLTKINALYSYGGEHDPDEPEKFPTQAIEGLTGVTLHHTLILSLDQVATVIDLVGGIDVDVPQGFVDSEFPRPDVDVTIERDPTKLYQTIAFTQGVEHMTGDRALQFIRSRHAEGDEGSDLARSNRQQLVTQALINALLNKQVLLDPVKLGQLYRFYQENFASYLPLEELVATAKVLLPMRNSFSLTPHNLSIYPEDQAGVLFHPPLARLYQNQWVYVVRDRDQFKTEVQQKLNSN